MQWARFGCVAALVGVMSAGGAHAQTSEPVQPVPLPSSDAPAPTTPGAIAPEVAPAPVTPAPADSAPAATEPPPDPARRIPWQAGQWLQADSKEDARPPGKLDRRPKWKEGVGYPIAMPGDFRLSFYWLAWESDYGYEAYDTPIYTREGYFIGRFPVGFVFELKLEGSGVLLDGRVLNYDGSCKWGMGTCFRTTDPAEHPLGAGVQHRPLEPFRSIAVDPKYIPIGSPVWVPELAGIAMPDGSRHDGCLRADDQGGAIKQHKLDFFVESYRNFKFIGENLWWKLKATPHLEEPRCEYLRLKPPIDRSRDNERSDYLLLKKNGGKLRQADKTSLQKTKHEREKALAWTKHHNALGSSAPSTKPKQKKSK